MSSSKDERVFQKGENGFCETPVSPAPRFHHQIKEGKWSNSAISHRIFERNVAFQCFPSDAEISYAFFLFAIPRSFRKRDYRP